MLLASLVNHLLEEPGLLVLVLESALELPLLRGELLLEGLLPQLPPHLVLLASQVSVLGRREESSVGAKTCLKALSLFNSTS